MLTVQLCFYRSRPFLPISKRAGWRSYHHTAPRQRMRHRVDRGYYGVLSDHIVNSTSDPLYLEAAATLRESRSIDPLVPRLLELTESNPTEKIAWHLLASGNASNPEALTSLYRQAKARDVAFPGLLNTIVDFLIRKNGNFNGAFEIFHENKNVEVARIEQFINLAKDKLSLKKLWNEIIRKSRFEPSERPLMSPVAIYAYSQALARFSFIEARDFTINISSKNRDVNPWIGLIEAVGASKNLPHLHETFRLSQAHKIPFAKISGKLFGALARILPYKVYAAFQGESVNSSKSKEKELFNLINPISISESHLPRGGSVWEIPLMGFLLNERWNDAEQVVFHAEEAYDLNFQTLYLTYFDCARKHAPAETCLDWLRLLQKKRLDQECHYIRLIQDFEERGLKEAIKIVNGMRTSGDKPISLLSSTNPCAGISMHARNHVKRVI